jgi:hypothetical protein
MRAGSLSKSMLWPCACLNRRGAEARGRWPDRTVARSSGRQPGVATSLRRMSGISGFSNFSDQRATIIADTIEPRDLPGAVGILDADSAFPSHVMRTRG